MLSVPVISLVIWLVCGNLASSTKPLNSLHYRVIKVYHVPPLDGSSAQITDRCKETTEARRIDKVLSQLWASSSATSIKNSIRRGLVLVNNQSTSTDFVVEPGDTITLLERDVPISPSTSEKCGSSEQLVPAPSSPLLTEENRISIAFEDAYLAIVNKPFGLPVFASSKKEYHGVAVHSQVLPALQRVNQSGLQPLIRPQPVHRLDDETGGLLVVAKTRPALVRLSEMFARREIEKQYLALCLGRLTQPVLSIHIPLGGKDAHTDVEVIQEFPCAAFGYVSLVRITLHTGRTHQIRRHLSCIGHPILGDKRYWFSDDSGLRSQSSDSSEQRMKQRQPLLSTLPHMLFCYRIAFSHPIPAMNEQKIVVELDRPEIFQQLIRQLTK